MVEMVGFRLVNSILVQRVLIDDTSKVLYKRSDEETEFFYLRSRVSKYMVTECTQGCPSKGQNMMMLEKYGLEWEMILPSEVKDLTYLGDAYCESGQGSKDFF